MTPDEIQALAERLSRRFRDRRFWRKTGVVIEVTHREAEVISMALRLLGPSPLIVASPNAQGAAAIGINWKEMTTSD